MNTLFVITSMPVGGAEVLLTSLIRKLDRTKVNPFLACLKELGPLGEELSREVPTFHHLIGSRWDGRVLWRLVKLIRANHIEAVVTVGAGDKMFWGRLAAKIANVPVICSALHSTGWPDGVGKLNRMLTPITDSFIAVANAHGQFLVDFEKFPANKVAVIPNGIDLNRFESNQAERYDLRHELGLPEDTKLIGIVAALRTEKNHLRFLDVAARVQQSVANVHFVIVGDGPERGKIDDRVGELRMEGRVHMLGSRSDIHRLLPSFDVFTLTSDNEANPVSILEALACRVPVVATDVGSVNEMVLDGRTGYVVPKADVDLFADRVVQLLTDADRASMFGTLGREHVLEHGSLEAMVTGYERLLNRILKSKQASNQVRQSYQPAKANNS